MDPLKVTFTMLDDGGMFRQFTEDVRFHPVFILLGVTHGVFSARTPIGSLFDRVLAQGIRDHFRSLFVRRREIDFIAEIEQENLRFFPTTHGRDV